MDSDIIGVALGAKMASAASSGFGRLRRQMASVVGSRRRGAKVVGSPLKWLKRSGPGKGYWMTAKDKAEFKQATQHGVCVVTEKKDPHCRPKRVVGQKEMCEEGKTDLLIFAYPPRMKANKLKVQTGLKDAKVGAYMTISFFDIMKGPGSCKAVNKFPGMKGSHGSPGDCSNYYTRSEYVAALCSRGRPDKNGG